MPFHYIIPKNSFIYKYSKFNYRQRSERFLINLKYNDFEDKRSERFLINLKYNDFEDKRSERFLINLKYNDFEDKRQMKTLVNEYMYLFKNCSQDFKKSIYNYNNYEKCTHRHD
jgi:hypothetical protein